MATKLNLGCGFDRIEVGDWVNIDVNPKCNPDTILDLNDLQWPFDNQSVDYIIMSHVLEHLNDEKTALRECARILKPGGVLEIKMPVGLDMDSDPTHKQDNTWTWRTPEFYNGKRHWDSDIGIKLLDRKVDIWVQKPGVFGWIQKNKIRYMKYRYDDGEWCFGLESTSGEFTVKYKKLSLGD